MPRIAVCFYGIPRSLEFTIESIQEHVLLPAHQRGSVRLAGHFFDQAVIENPRTKEAGVLDRETWRLLEPDQIILEKDGGDEVRAAYNIARSGNDVFNDNYRSVFNLVKQTWSIYQVARLVEEWSPDCVVFVRPDLRYLDGFGPVIDKALETSGCYVPAWQDWGGMNDRFAVVSGEAVKVWSGRFKRIEDFVFENGHLHSESLVDFVMQRSGAPVYRISQRAERVRASGQVVDEDFSLQHACVC